MSLDRYYTLGRSGLRVSRLALGTMTFGTHWGWGADEKNSRAIFDRYLDAGGNFLDTADVYTGGNSERMLGKFIAEAGVRDRVVLSTKYTFSDSFNGGKPDATGTGAGSREPGAGERRSLRFCRFPAPGYRFPATIENWRSTKCYDAN
jgi:aryl-alcohol dehydrogenase-like predicted oxidoreductase